MNNGSLYIIETDDGESGRRDDYVPLFGKREYISRERKQLIPVVKRLKQEARRLKWKARYRIAKWIRASDLFKD